MGGGGDGGGGGRHVLDGGGGRLRRDLAARDLAGQAGQRRGVLKDRVGHGRTVRQRQRRSLRQRRRRRGPKDIREGRRQHGGDVAPAQSRHLQQVHSGQIERHAGRGEGHQGVIADGGPI